MNPPCKQTHTYIYKCTYYIYLYIGFQKLLDAIEWGYLPSLENFFLGGHGLTSSTVAKLNHGDQTGLIRLLTIIGKMLSHGYVY